MCRRIQGCKSGEEALAHPLSRCLLLSQHRLIATLLLLQRNFLDVAAPGFTRPSEVVGAGIPDAEWRASGYGSADAFAWARPVEAVYAGAGHLRLPIEAAALDAPPAPLGTGDASVPLFTCNASWADPLDEGGEGAWATDWSHAGESLVAGEGVSAGQALFVLSGCNASQEGGVGLAGCIAGTPLSAVFDAAGNTSGSAASGGSPLSRTAFASYAYCMAACNRAVLAPVWVRGWAAANASGGRVAPWQAADDWCAASSASASSQPPRYPFYVDAAAAGGAGAQRAYYSPPAPTAACWLPGPCAAFSSVSRRDQRARVSGAYDRYVDVLMSEALRGGASLSVDTPLTVTTLPRDPTSGFTLQRSYLAKARVMASKMPNFFFSSYVRALWGGGEESRVDS